MVATVFGVVRNGISGSRNYYKGREGWNVESSVCWVLVSGVEGGEGGEKGEGKKEKRTETGSGELGLSNPGEIRLPACCCLKCHSQATQSPVYAFCPVGPQVFKQTNLRLWRSSGKTRSLGRSYRCNRI